MRADRLGETQIRNAISDRLPVGTLTDQGRAVLASVAAGHLAPTQGSQLIAAIGQLASVAKVDELERRITEMENQHGNA